MSECEHKWTEWKADEVGDVMATRWCEKCEADDERTLRPYGTHKLHNGGGDYALTVDNKLKMVRWYMDDFDLMQKFIRIMNEVDLIREHIAASDCLCTRPDADDDPPCERCRLLGVLEQ